MILFETQNVFNQIKKSSVISLVEIPFPIETMYYSMCVLYIHSNRLQFVTFLVVPRQKDMDKTIK